MNKKLAFWRNIYIVIFLNATLYMYSNAILASNNIDNWESKLNAKSAQETNIIIKKGEKLTDVLQKIGLEKAEKTLLLRSIKKIYNPNKISAGQLITVNLNKNNKIITFETNIDKRYKLIARYYNYNHINAQIVPNQLSRKLIAISAFVKEPLSSSKISHTTPTYIIEQLRSLYTQRKELHSILKTGAKLDLVFEQFVDKNNKVRIHGNIIYASVKSKNHVSTELFYYKSINQNEGYFDQHGNYFNAKDRLLQLPLENNVVSSRFGDRLHPIYKRKIYHKGVDLVAPINTKITSAGNGTVEYIGQKGGYGKYIKIKHNESYSTAYAHLNKFEKSLEVGSRVKLGQVIGYSGNTGNVTGPHLHYEVIFNGVPVNPIIVHNNIEKMQHLEGLDLVKFKRTVAQVKEIMEGFNVR